MLPQIQEFFENLVRPRPEFSLQDLENFPYSEYNRNMSRYTRLESWYSGEALNETVERQGKEIELYPVKYNPLPRTVEQHTYYLFGQVRQDERPLVYPKVNPPDTTNEGQIKSAKDLEDILYRLWSESNGRAIQWQNGAQSQLYGGNIFRLVYTPKDPLRTIPLRIESIHPKSFIGIPDGADFWRMRETWIIRAINHREAFEHGVSLDDNIQPWMIEHTTDDGIEVTINGEPARRNEKWLTRENRYGFVPQVYIPHIRVYGFYGETFIENVQGVIREMNLRLADYGDAVTTDAHRYMKMKNVSGTPTVQQIAPGLYAINLHSNPYITGNEKEPDLEEVGTNRASDPMQKLGESLLSIYRRLVAVPGIADGEDEGSQRSAATLVTRMISLVSHTDSERIFWTTGLNLLTRMAVKMLLMTPGDVLEVKNVAVKPEHVLYPIRHEWAPVLPRDRELLVQEAATLMAGKLGSIERLLDTLGVDNPSEERDKILKDLKELQKLMTPPQPEGQAEKRGIQGSSQEAAKGTPAREANQE